MKIDENMLCPVCKAKLFTDEVAFCPDCGAPHHKSCYLQLGHCAYADKHGTPEQWQPPKIEPPRTTDFDNQTAEQNENNQNPNPNNAFNTQFQGEFNNSRTSQENPFFTSNGIDRNEYIGGESAENIAKFVGYNALRYINIFRKMAALRKKINWNWVAFLVPEYWLVSRKCYYPSILVALYSVLYSIFYSLGTANSAVQNFMATGIVTDEVLKISGVLFIGSLLSLVIKIFMGMFGDYIYKKKVYSSIDAMKKEGKTTEIDFMQKGGVNLMLPMLLFFAVNLVSLVIMSFI